MFLLLEILGVALLAIAIARLGKEPWRGRLLNLLKAWVTIRAFWLLLSHPVKLDDGSRVVAAQLVLDTLKSLDAGTFFLFCACAAGIKFVGILASMYRWLLLLRGQKIELPFRHIFGSFLIGRFIGTFLPSTAGLDGYTLYDAARFSGKSVEVTAAKFLEKILGITGIFLSYLVALPAGIGMFHSILGEERGDLVLGNSLVGFDLIADAEVVGDPAEAEEARTEAHLRRARTGPIDRRIQKRRRVEHAPRRDDP